MSERVALITGCSSGFGLLAAVDFAKAGFRVVATMRNLGKQDRLLAAAREAGVAVDVQPLDVTDAESILAAREYVEKEIGRLDVLVNNAGYGLVGPMDDVPLDALRAQFETNVFGVAEVTKAFLPIMRRQRSGRVINISSMAGRTSAPFFSPYFGSKWALEGLSECWRYEFRPFGIHVSVIEPGAFKTEFDQGSMVKARDPENPFHAITVALEEKTARFRPYMGDPRVVSRRILEAATAARPRFRYPVGVDAWAESFLWWALPIDWIQWIVGRAMSVPRAM